MTGRPRVEGDKKEEKGKGGGGGGGGNVQIDWKRRRLVGGPKWQIHGW